jgi:hypothetical protein
MTTLAPARGHRASITAIDTFIDHENCLPKSIGYWRRPPNVQGRKPVVHRIKSLFRGGIFVARNKQKIH